MAIKTYGKNNPKTAAGKTAAKSSPKKAPLTERQSNAEHAKTAGKKNADTTLAKSRAALPPSSVAMGNQDDVSGEVDSSDIKLPYLALVQGVGDLSANFTPGQFVLAGEIELTAAPEKEKTGDPLDISIVWAKKQFIEKLPYGEGGEMPRIFDTSEQAKEAGLVTEWIDNEPPSAGPMLTCLVLVEKPEGVEEDPRFSLEYDGRFFAPCLWRIKSTAYNRAGKAILTAKALAKSEPLCSRKFQVSAKREKVGKNWVFTPNIRAFGKADADFVAFVKENAK